MKQTLVTHLCCPAENFGSFQWYIKKIRYLYGDTTLSGLRLALTDDDTSSHSAFDAVTTAMKEISSAKHMLCVFHAVVVRYQNFVYGYLPKTQDSKTLATEGEIYGEMTLSSS